jgi:hypothetical protein
MLLLLKPCGRLFNIIENTHLNLLQQRMLSEVVASIYDNLERIDLAPVV